MTDAGEWMDLFSTYRIVVTERDEIIHGTLRPDLALEDPEVGRILAAWKGPSHAARLPDRTEVTLVRSVIPEPPPRLALHALLFLATLFTTMAAGSLLTGVDPLRGVPLELGPVWLPVPTGVDWGALLRGAPFALTLMAILLGHELGHYVVARRLHLRVTLPYFIPFPPYFSIVGTLGAFIRLRSPLIHRRMLFDVAIGGPLVSFVLSIPALVIGLRWSTLAPGVGDAVTPFVVPFAGEAIWIGNSLALAGLADLIVGEAGPAWIVLHPVAFAAWLGLFVTALNLLPFGQLDGGHILYALVGRRQRLLAVALLAVLFPLGWLWWGWWLWLGVAIVIGRGRLGHPPVLQEGEELPRGRRALGWAAVAVFLLIFAPVPVRM